MKEIPDEKLDYRLGLTLGFFMLAIICFFVLPMAQGVELYFFSVALGVGFAIMGFVNLTLIFKKSIKKDKRGALWIWAVCLLAIVTLAIGWFTLTWPTFILIETIENVYTFPPEQQNAINLIKTVMGWFLIFMSLGLLLWAYVNSQRREDVTYPIG